MGGMAREPVRPRTVSMERSIPEEGGKYVLAKCTDGCILSFHSTCYSKNIQCELADEEGDTTPCLNPKTAAAGGGGGAGGAPLCEGTLYRLFSLRQRHPEGGGW